MKCFGMEQSPSNPLCPACPHKADCAALMEHLINRIPVDQARFHFVPQLMAEKFKVDEVYRSDVDVADIEKVYVFCHDWVFGSKPRNRIGTAHRNVILFRVREAETSVKLFFLTNMYAWRQAKASAFSPKLLTTEHAVKSVRSFAVACHQEFGAFDTTSLDMLFKNERGKAWIEERLLRSEVLVGGWIIRYKMFHTGQMVERLYQEKEEALDPHWLAIEGSYYSNTLVYHMNSPRPDLPPTTSKHRWSVLHALGKLKTHPREALSIFTARERIMPKAVREVLNRLGFDTTDFLMEDVPVTNALKFWGRLATAIQQYECLNFVDKIPSAFDDPRFRSGF